jgi:hypothetical protein
LADLYHFDAISPSARDAELIYFPLRELERERIELVHTHIADLLLPIIYTQA